MSLELIRLSDGRLARRMVMYIDSTQSLIVRAEYFSDGQCPAAELEDIRREYTALRAAVRAEAEYIAYAKKTAAGSPLYENKYAPSVAAASAWGFQAPDDSKPGKELLKALRDGEKHLLSRYPADYWRILAQDE